MARREVDVIVAEQMEAMECDAAVRIQAMHRGRTARSEVDALAAQLQAELIQLQAEAAVKLQALQRGSGGQRDAAALQAKLEAEMEAQVAQAAVRIQAVSRGLRELQRRLGTLPAGRCRTEGRRGAPRTNVACLRRRALPSPPRPQGARRGWGYEAGNV